MRHEPFLGLIVEVAQVFAAELLVLLEVVIAAMGDAFQLAPAPGELVFHVAGADGVERQFFLVVLAQAQVVALQAQVLIPLEALVAPRRDTTPGWSRGLQKNSISICSNSRERKMNCLGVISLRKALPIWAMPKGTLMRVESHDVLEVDEDALRRFRAQVDHRRALLDRADERLEHQVELARLGELALGEFAGMLRGLSRALALGDLVGAEACLARLAVDQRVGEVPPRGRWPARPCGS